MNTEMSSNPKSDRKVYSKDDMLRFFYCPKETPDYLKEFPVLLKGNVNDFWHKKPLPKFDETPDNKQRLNNSASKYKDRQRTFSSQSGESSEMYFNSKFRSPIQSSATKPKIEVYNRYNLLSESQINSSTIDDIIQNDDDSDWTIVESKTHKVSHPTKPYTPNYQGQENHWKKSNKGNTPTSEKNKLFNRNEKTNNFIVRKVDPNRKSEHSKIHTSQSFSMGTGQTEDIWQDDWDTEMQFPISYSPPESIESFELPPSTIAVSSHIDVRGPLPIPCHSPPSTDSTYPSDYNQWYYIDLSDTVQGPFHSENMANWLATGYFDYATKLRRKCDARFLLLAEYRALYGRIPFTMGATIPAILHDTKIEIDPMQLTIGVDRSILQQVLTNATSLSSFTNTNTISSLDHDISALNVIDQQILLEEKRQLDESKLELEKERQRIQDEQEQWKLKMEKEIEQRMQNFYLQQTMELNKTVSDFTTTPSSNDGLNVEKVTDSCKNEDLISMKNGEENSKSKIERSPDTQTLTDTSNSKKIDYSFPMNSEEIIGEFKQSVKINESATPESLSMWPIKPTIQSEPPNKVTKSLLEIQAEETKHEKTHHDKVEHNKIISFKESLLKGVNKPSRSLSNPMEKSVSDLQPVEKNSTLNTQKSVVDVKIKNSFGSNNEKSSLNDRSKDELLNWCVMKLTTYNGDLDVVTVVELLKQVPIENIPELTIELLDDSGYSRNFAKEFMKKREELLCSSATKKEEVWQTVKKQNTAPDKMKTVNASGGVGKSKSKKKMVVIDHTK